MRALAIAAALCAGGETGRMRHRPLSVPDGFTEREEEGS